MIPKALLPASLLVLAATACHHDMDGSVQGPDGMYPLDVPLHVAAHPPTVAIVAIGSDYTVDPVEEDLQQNFIGLNKEQGVEARATGPTPAQFMDRIVQQEMEACGVSLGDATAGHHIHIRLTRFFVDEDNTYNAQVAGTVDVRDAAGKVLASHSITGRAKQWGRSLSADNYAEVLSRAAFDFTKNLVSDKDLFAGAVSP
jgi:hypothetical protein